jgi:hypothetical protein
MDSLLTSTVGHGAAFGGGSRGCHREDREAGRGVLALSAAGKSRLPRLARHDKAVEWEMGGLEFQWAPFAF